MSNTALNRTGQLLLVNKSGGSVAQGDIVIVDTANAAAFTTTTTSGYVSGTPGVVLEPNGIANNATGMIAVQGYVPIINLSATGSIGDLIKTHTVAKQGVRNAAPAVAGNFAQALGTSATPVALLWGSVNLSAGAGSDTNAVHVNAANEINGITEKTTLTGNDLFIIEDSAASGVKKKVKQSNLGSSGNATSTGAAGSEPGSPASGDLYLQNNGPYLERYSGSAWIPWGPISPFTKPPAALTGATTTLNNGGTMNSGDTSCTVTDGSVLGTAPFIIQIGSEDIKVGARSSNSLTSLTRGYNSTSAASHTDGATVTLVNLEWVNQSTASVTFNADGSVWLTTPTLNSLNMRILKRLAPSTPYTVTAAMLIEAPLANYGNMGLIFRQSSNGKIHAMRYLQASGPYFNSVKHDSPTAYNNDYASVAQLANGLVWLQIQDNGTNRICSFSRNGVNFTQVHSVGRTDYITADEIGFFIDPQNASGPVSATLYSWEIT